MHEYNMGKNVETVWRVSFKLLDELRNSLETFNTWNQQGEEWEDVVGWESAVIG